MPPQKYSQLQWAIAMAQKEIGTGENPFVSKDFIAYVYSRTKGRRRSHQLQSLTESKLTELETHGILECNGGCYRFKK